MTDEAMERLLDYDRRRYWLENGWSVRFRIWRIEPSEARPHGLRYSLTLHDVDGTRLLGFDNAHQVGRDLGRDHRHRFRRIDDVEPYKFEDTDTLLGHFFEQVERACQSEGIPFEIIDEDLDFTEDRDEAPEPE